MPYEFLEEGVTADVTFRATGADLPALFAAAAAATTNAMVEALESVRPLVARSIGVEADDLEMLLYRFLGEIVFYKDAEALLMLAANIAIEETANSFRLRAELRGERIDPSRHALAGDVKAVTLHGLRVEHDGDLWSATVTLDV